MNLCVDELLCDVLFQVLFREVVFALPPRQRLGLFYNMPLVSVYTYSI